MTQMSRRSVIGGAAVTGGMAMASGGDGDLRRPAALRADARAAAGQGIAVASLRSGAAPNIPHDGGWSKEATVLNFPVSEKLAGVLMQLEPGGLRELHWHANAAEWAYVIKGRCRVTTIDPQGQCEIVDFGEGDVWYFPRGHGHSIQGIGPGDCEFILIFDNGYFSEFGTFSITDWIGHVPPEVLAKNFAVPAATFANFPKKEVYLVKGPVPPPLPADPAPGSLNPGR